jgi:hypothetical protein
MFQHGSQKIKIKLLFLGLNPQSPNENQKGLYHHEEILKETTHKFQRSAVIYAWRTIY